MSGCNLLTRAARRFALLTRSARSTRRSSLQDLVVWGHEHECLINPVESLKGQYHVVQPGSTVATSLVEGEAVPKHCGILEVCGDEFRLVPVPLETVRPFLVEEVSLNDVDDLDATQADGVTQMTEYLTGRVRQMIDSAKDAMADNDDGGDAPDASAMLPLLRLKVERSGFPTLNNQKFGAQFVGSVANPQDILLFHKRRGGADGPARRRAGAGGVDRAGDSVEDIIASMRNEENKLDMTDLVVETLEQSNTQLRILPEDDLNVAVHDFVHKQQNAAINEFVDATLVDVRKQLRKDHGASGQKEDIEESLKSHMDKKRKSAAQDRAKRGAAQRRRTARDKAAKASARGDGEEDGDGGDGGERKGGGSDDDSDQHRSDMDDRNDDDINDDDDDDNGGGGRRRPAAGKAKPRRGGAASRGSGGSGGSGRGGGSGGSSAASKRGAFFGGAGGAGGSNDDEEEVVESPARRKAGGRKAASKKSSRGRGSDDDDDDEEDDVDEIENSDDDGDSDAYKPPPKKSRGKSARATTSKTRGKASASKATKAKAAKATKAAAAKKTTRRKAVSKQSTIEIDDSDENDGDQGKSYAGTSYANSFAVDDDDDDSDQQPSASTNRRRNRRRG